MTTGKGHRNQSAHKGRTETFAKHRQAKKKVANFFVFPLDKPQKMCYNNSTKAKENITYENFCI